MRFCFGGLAGRVRNGFLSATIFFVAGCASSPITTDLDLAYSNTDNVGRVIGSVSSATKHISKAALLFRKDGGGGGSITTDFPVEFQEAGKRGAVFELPLPAGQYAFFRFKSSYVIGFFETEYWSKREFYLPFKVEKGKTTYLGEFHFVPTSAAGYFVIGDELMRDLKLLAKKYPKLDLKDIQMAIPNVKSLDLPYIRWPINR